MTQPDTAHPPNDLLAWMLLKHSEAIRRLLRSVEPMHPSELTKLRKALEMVDRVHDEVRFLTVHGETRTDFELRKMTQGR